MRGSILPPINSALPSNFARSASVAFGIAIVDIRQSSAARIGIPAS
jgi:hypothetical protein